MEGTGKKIEKKLTTRDLWSANFNLTNTLGFAKQYIYQILHNITERYLIINRNLYFYKQTTNVSLSLLCQSPMTGFSCDCSRLKVSQATALYIAPMVSLLAITLVFEY